jgi:hypothetical protein
MRAQYEAQPHNNNANKWQKTTYSQPKQDGDLHVLLDTTVFGAGAPEFLKI